MAKNLKKLNDLENKLHEKAIMTQLIIRNHRDYMLQTATKTH